jgi:hypothetical protein
VIVAVAEPSDGIEVALVIAVNAAATTVVVPPLLLLLLLPPLLLLLLDVLSLPADCVSFEPLQADSNTRPSKAIDDNLRMSFIPWKTDDGQCH